MEINEKTIQYLEEHIPELADASTRQAYWQTLASGNSVLISENGDLIEVSPDGTRQTVKKLEPFVKVQKGNIKLK